MALGSYNLSHHRQSTYYHLRADINLEGVDFQSAVGNIGLDNPVTAITMDGVDFLSAVGEDGFGIGIRRCQIGHDASSFYVGKNISTNPSSIVRMFRFAEADRSDRVVKYPKIKRNYTEVVAKPFTINLENASQLFNSIIEDRTQFKQTGMVEYGYTSDTYSADLLCLGGGFLTNADYNNGQVSFTFKNQMGKLAETRMSVDTTSRQGISYVGSEWNPADLTWTILTVNSLALGLSSIESFTNPDINYDSWKDWYDTLDSENITVNGFFPFSTNYQQALQSIAENTDSAIYVEGDNRIYFKRNLVGVESFAATVQNSDIVSISTKGDAYDMCNQYSVPMSYAVTGGSLGNPHSTVTFDDTASQNSFGIVQHEPTTQLVWYTNSANANNLAQRIVYRRKEPEVALSITTPIKYLNQQLADLFYITHEATAMYDVPYTLIGESINIESQTMVLDLSVGHGIAVANMSVFTLGDDISGRLNNTVGVLG